MKIVAFDTTPTKVPIEPSRATVGDRGTHTEYPFLILEVRTL